MTVLEIGGLILVIMIGIAVPAIPLFRYIGVGSRVKANEILDALTDEAQADYFAMFSRNSRKSFPDESFSDYYDRWFGKRYFILPALLFLIVTAYLVTLLAFTALTKFQAAEGLGWFHYALPKTAVEAIAGAYMWVTSDFIARARSLDFSPSDVMWGVLRLVIAVPLGSAFTSLAHDVAGTMIPFALGAFPLTQLVTMLQKAVYALLKQSPPTDSIRDSVMKLQGIDEALTTRLADEDISTVAQLAYCDPVRLAMRSNLTFTFVIDCMNQALAWMYFEEQMNVLRSLGLRGASEIADLTAALCSTDPEIKSEAESTLKDVVAAVQPPHSEATMKAAFGQIADDPYTHFLRHVWYDPFANEADGVEKCTPSPAISAHAMHPTEAV